MYTIQTLNNISDLGITLLSKEEYVVVKETNTPDGVLLRSYNMNEMEMPESLKGIARAGAGVNNIPVEKCAEKGIVVFNTPGANANAVKELVLAGLLLSSRRVVDGIQWAKTLIGNGKEVPKLVEKGKADFVGPEIAGKKLGVIGLGAIGVMVANDAKALGMEVVGYDPYISVDAAWGLSRSIQRAVSLEQLISTCDYITIHVPLMDKTKYMMNKDLFAQMKDEVRILNFSRAELVHNEDMKEALESGKVAAYVTDFPDEAVLQMKNVIPIPHLGASTPESEDNCAIMAVQELKSFLETGNIKNSVNYPDCELPYIGKKRITIAHKNIPNMVGQITTVLATESINIADMLNKSKGNWAYTLIDIDSEGSESIIASLMEIEGVTAVRII